MSDVWNDFLDSINGRDVYLKDKLIDFATYLGFDEKEITGPIFVADSFTARTEVDFDDRKISISIINDFETRGTYIVYDNKDSLLDIIKFRYEDGKWEEYE